MLPILLCVHVIHIFTLEYFFIPHPDKLALPQALTLEPCHKFSFSSKYARLKGSQKLESMLSNPNFHMSVCCAAMPQEVTTLLGVSLHCFVMIAIYSNTPLIE